MIGALFPLVRPALLAADPERAHDWTIRALQLWPQSNASPSDAPLSDPALAVEAFGLRFPNPVGFAAGFDKDGRVAAALFRLGFGAVEIGSVTPLPQPGNPRPRLFRSGRREGAIVNRFGFNSDGHAVVHARLSAMRGGRAGVLGVNLGANKEAADRAADYCAGVKAFADVADYFTINVSSPNTPGLRDLQARATLDDLAARVVAARDGALQAGPPRPILLKIAPDLSLHALDDVVAVARARKLDGMVVSNTTLARPSDVPALLAREAGGLSGRPLFTRSTRMLAETFLRVEGALSLVGVGGVDGPEAALAKIRAGAHLVQLYSALVFEGPALVGRILAGLSSAITAAPEGTLAGLVGRDAAALAAEPFP